MRRTSNYQNLTIQNSLQENQSATTVNNGKMISDSGMLKNLLKIPQKICK